MGTLSTNFKQNHSRMPKDTKVCIQNLTKKHTSREYNQQLNGMRERRRKLQVSMSSPERSPKNDGGMSGIDRNSGEIYFGDNNGGLGLKMGN